MVQNNVVGNQIFEGEKARIPALDGIRFFAALLVFLGHAGISIFSGDGSICFFVLTGFLVTYNFSGEWKATGRIDIRRFLSKRFIRIFPAFFVAILFTIFAKIVLNLPVSWSHAISALTFTANYYNAFFNHPPTGFANYWSLAVSEQFYLIWPFTFIYFRRKGEINVVKFLFFSICIIIFSRTVIYSLDSFKFVTAYLYNSFETRFDSLAMGALIGLFYRLENFEKFFRKISKTGLEPLVTLAMLFALQKLSTTMHYTLGFTLQSLAVSLLIIQLITLEKNILWQWLSSSYLVFLGRLSYSFYLYHSWGLAVGPKFVHLPHFAQLLISFLATIVMAIFSYRYIEQPLQRLGSASL